MTQPQVTIPRGDAGDEFVIDLIDFTPGIYADLTAGSGQQGAPEGAAQLTGTLGCIGSPSGGLIAGPRITQSYQETRMDSGFTASSDGARTAIMAFRAVSPVQPTIITDAQLATQNPRIQGHVLTYPDFLVVGYQNFFEKTAAVVNQWSRVVGYKMHTTPVRSALMISRGGVDSGSAGTIGSPFLYGWVSIEMGRTAPPTVAAAQGPNTISVAAGIYGTRNALAGVRAFPSFYAVSFRPADSAAVISLGAPTRLLTHQGRLVVLTLFDQSNLLSSGQQVVGSEYLAASVADDWFTQELGSAPKVVFVEENPGDIGVMASMNASEMVVVKAIGGGYSVRGSLADPTVTRLPGLPSTGRAHNVPANTPFGLIYGTESGVWQYTGGDTAQLLSPQLDGWFWKPHAIVDQWAGPKGSFAWAYPFLFSPNNFIMDQRTGSWWRFGKPSKRAYAWHTRSAVGGVVLCGPSYLDATQTTLCDWFDVSQGCHTYSWVSHPLRRTRDRVHNFQWITLIAQGSGTVTITLTGIGGTTVTETFALTSTTQEVAIRKPSRMEGHDIVVTITSTATLTSGVAPRVDRVHFAGASKERVAQS